MGIQQKAGRLTPAMAVLVCGALLIAGCSDSQTIDTGANMQRNNFQQGQAPVISSPPVKEAVTEAPNSAGQWGNIGPWYVLKPGGSYTFTWTGGAGNKADLVITRWDNKKRIHVKVWSATTANNGSYRLTVPFEPGGYNFNVATYFDHPACALAGPLRGGGTSCFPATCPGATLWYTPLSKYPWPPIGDAAAAPGRDFALNECRARTASYGGDPNTCQILNSQICRTGASGVAFSDSFFVESFTPGSGGASSIYYQIENSQSNRNAIAAAVGAANNQSAPKTNVVQISTGANVVDDKSVKHVATGTAMSGR
jgi:hypothetical protein